MPKTTPKQKPKSSPSNTIRWVGFVFLVLLFAAAAASLFTPAAAPQEVPLSDVIARANTADSDIAKITVVGNELQITLKGDDYYTQVSRKDPSGTLYDQGLIDHCATLTGDELTACQSQYPVIEYQEVSNFWDYALTAATIIIAAVVMVLYVVFGGTKGAGIVGILKLVLLYASMVLCGILALSHIGGVGALMDTVQGFNAELGRNLFSPFCRGVGTDLGAGISLLLGVLTTQTYAQAVLSAKSTSQARVGAVVSAVLIPIIGIFGIIVGLYMRTVTDPSTFVTSTALTSFILDYSGLPPLVAGLVLGALFIATVGTGAGLALGIATIINRELIQKNGKEHKMSPDTVNKLLIVVVLAVAALISCTPIGDTILTFAFMSMGLRGCTVFAPLCFLIWAKGKVDGKYALASILGGSLVALVLGILSNIVGVITLPCDAVFPGIAVGLIIMFIGLAAGKGKKTLAA